MDYKVVFIPVLGGEGAFEQEFEVLDSAIAAFEAIANYTLMLHECSLMPDHTNAGMVLKRDDDGEWVEIDSV